MDLISNKLKILSKITRINENNNKCIQILDSMNEKKFDDKSVEVKTLGIECKELELNEDNRRSIEFKCFWPKCRFTSADSERLRSHVITHSNRRQIICEKCDKRFARLSNLNQHKRRFHSIEKPIES